MTKNIDPTQIDNIIFDLGNVIIRLDIEATNTAFKQIYGKDYVSAMNVLNNQDVFNQYEKGKISTAYFLDELQKQVKDTISKTDLSSAWNAMLLDIPESRFKLLNKVQKEYRTFCLSNTNEMHIDFIHQQLKETKEIPNLNSYFEKVYLSHEMGMRKPDVEIFDKVIEENRLNPDRTIFIDDTAGHLEGAKKAGIKVLHLTSFQLLEDIL